MYKPDGPTTEAEREEWLIQGESISTRNSLGPNVWARRTMRLARQVTYLEKQLEFALDAGKRAVEAELITEISPYRMTTFIEWLKRPNGSFMLQMKDQKPYIIGVAEAVEGGGIWIRSRRRNR